MDKGLLEACMSGDDQALQALIQRDPLILDRAVTHCQETPLHVAAMRGHVSCVKALLGLQRELASERDASGCVPLHLASAKGSAEVVRELLSVDAELCSARDHGGRTPLHLAVMKGRLDVVREFIRVCPRSASERLDRGETVFHLSVKYCRLDVLKLLEELLKNDHPQLLLATDDKGNTVLHFSAIFKQIGTVKYLVSLEEVKEIANVTNGNGHTVLDDVMENSVKDFNSFEIVEILTQVGVRRGNNNPTIVLHSPPLTTANSLHTGTRTPLRIVKWFHHVLDYLTFKHQMNWIVDAHGNLMVVATLIASIAYQAGVNPPGGVWQEDTIDNRTCTKPGMCRAGTAVHKDAEVFHYFYLGNTWALMAAVCVILLHFGGFPLKNRVSIWLMTTTTCLMLHNILGAYLFSTDMVIGVTPPRENKTSLQTSYAWTIIGVVIMLIVIIHSISIWYWLMFDKVTRSGLCRFKWIRAVACLVGIFVTLLVLKVTLTVY